MLQPSSYTGILLAGPPASGKRTVAFALTSLRRSYARVPALTTATDPPVDAEPAARAHLDELRSWAQVLHEFTVDGSGYLYDRERPAGLREQGRLPVVCVEDADAPAAFRRESAGWLPVLLWCPAPEARARAGRGLRGPVDRGWTRRWERSSTALLGAATHFTLTLRTDRLDAVDAARIIHAAAQATAPG